MYENSIHTGADVELMHELFKSGEAFGGPQGEIQRLETVGTASFRFFAHVYLARGIVAYEHYGESGFATVLACEFFRSRLRVS